MKTTIDRNRALDLLLKGLNAKEEDWLACQVYNAIQDLFMQRVANIEGDHEIIGEDGTPYRETDSFQWYDDDTYEDNRETFFGLCYRKIHDDIVNCD